MLNLSLYAATWGRVFAALYDRSLARVEDAGLRDRRHDLLTRAGGATLELGAGTGLNLPHYPLEVNELVLSEPSTSMAARLRRKLPGVARPVEVVEALGERLPFQASRFDTVVATLVLCTVRDPAATIREVVRVLKPGGCFLFLEHVRSEDARLAAWQDRLRGPWNLIADGCVCNRQTDRMLADSALLIEHLEHAELLKAGPLVRPLIAGVARKP